MSSYSSNNNNYVGGGYNNPDEMAAQGWGQNHGQYGGSESYSNNAASTGMGQRGYPRRGPSPPFDPQPRLTSTGSHTFGSGNSPEMGTGTRARRTTSYDDDGYNAGGARGPRSGSTMEDPYSPGGRARDASYERRSSRARASSTRSFDDSQNLGEGASGRGSLGYQTGMGKNMQGERPSSYGTSYDNTGSTSGTSSKPGTGGWKGAAKRLVSRF
jgi:hypothetical protein